METVKEKIDWIIGRKNEAQKILDEIREEYPSVSFVVSDKPKKQSIGCIINTDDFQKQFLTNTK